MIQSVCFRVFLLAFVLLLKSSNSLERIYEIMFAHTKLICFVLHLLLFSFQRSMRPADPALPVRIPSVPLCAFSLRQPIYYTTFRSVCQGVFEKFFEVFFKPLSLLPLSPVFQRYPCPFTGALDYYTTFLPVCQVGFEKFLKFFRGLSLFDKPLRLCFCFFPLSRVTIGFYQAFILGTRLLYHFSASLSRVFSTKTYTKTTVLRCRKTSLFTVHRIKSRNPPTNRQSVGEPYDTGEIRSPE